MKATTGGRTYVEYTNDRLWRVTACNTTNYIILGRGSKSLTNDSLSPPRNL